MTTDPPGPLMPTSCENTSAGVTYGPKFSGELAPCAAAIEGDMRDPAVCPWFRSPEKPAPNGGSGGGLPLLPIRASGAPKVGLFAGDCRLVGSTVSCDGLLNRP